MAAVQTRLDTDERRWRLSEKRRCDSTAVLQPAALTRSSSSDAILIPQDFARQPALAAGLLERKSPSNAQARSCSRISSPIWAARGLPRRVPPRIASRSRSSCVPMWSRRRLALPRRACLLTDKCAPWPSGPRDVTTLHTSDVIASGRPPRARWVARSAQPLRSVLQQSAERIAPTADCGSRLAESARA